MFNLITYIKSIDKGDILLTLIFVLLLRQAYFDNKRKWTRLFKIFRKESYESLEAKLSSLNKSNVGIIATNLEGTILTANSVIGEMFRWDVKALLHNNIKVLIPDRFLENHVKGMHLLAETGESNLIDKTNELVGLRHDGTEFPIQMIIRKAEIDDKVLYVGIIKDITGEKELEYIHTQQIQFFKDSVMLYEEVERVGENGGFLWDLNRQRVRLTKGMSVIFGSEEREVTIDHFMKRISSLDKKEVNEAIDNAFNKQNTNFKCRIIRPDDFTVAEVECKLGNKTDKDGIVIEIYGFVKIIKILNHTDAGFL